MIRILQCVNNMHRAGLETLLMNYYRHMDREQIQFDFLMHRAQRSDYDDEIESMGGRIYRAPRLYPQNYPAYFAYMARFFREHPEYTIVHSHIDAMSYLPLLAAKRAGVPVRIAHSHNTDIDKDFKYPLKQAFRFLLPRAASHKAACGSEAGRFLFRGGDFHIIPNAVEAGRFAFDEAVRAEKRQELGLGEGLVIGHAGRFTPVKNHGFLLKVFDKLLEKRPDARLLLAGTGELEQKMKEKAADMGLGDRVLFLGSRGDMAGLYQAMDVFVLPSLFEGLPVVGVEAQYAGLPCLFSDRITRELAFTENCRFLPIEWEAERWAEELLHCADKSGERGGMYCPDYDIEVAAAALEEYYLALHSLTK